MPAYNRPDAMPRALDTLLSQTYRQFAIVIVDDKPTPEVQAAVDTYAQSDPRIRYEPNPVRLGMIGNWRKAFDRAHALYPEAEYFAWVSDHDMWHPRWLEALVAALDAQPEVVLTYPQMQRVYPSHRRDVTRIFDTAKLATPLQRLRAAQSGMAAGNCIYGLFRAAVLARAGVFRPVLAPDRQVIVECLLLGRSHHVPEVLWYREVAGMFSYGRQRTMFFTSGVPLHTYLPASVQHFGVLLWDLCVCGRGRPAFGRLRGAGYAMAALWYESRRDILKPDAPWRVALHTTRLGRWLTSGRPLRGPESDDEMATPGDVARRLR